MNFDADTLKTRKPLWIALSDLFLDTELQDYNHEHIAKVMHESDYSFAEIEDILMLEVFPVCIGNLNYVAGEWAGFHEDWVIKTIIKSKPPGRYRRWMNRRSFWMTEAVLTILNGFWQRHVFKVEALVFKHSYSMV